MNSMAQTAASGNGRRAGNTWPSISGDFQPISNTSVSIAGVIGLVIGVGWLLGEWRYGTFGHGYVPMAPATAWLFVLLSMLMFLRTRLLQSRRAALVSMVLPLMVLATVLTNTDWRGSIEIERHFTLRAGDLPGVRTGWMSPLTGAAFLLCSLGVVLSMPWITRHRSARLTALVMGCTVLSLGLVVLLSYIMNAPLLYDGHTVPMAVGTAVCFVLLAFGIVTGAGLEKWYWNYKGQRWLLTVCVLCCLAILGRGAWSFRTQNVLYEREAVNQLTAISTIKVHQIEQWRKERLGDAAVLNSSLLFKEAAREWMRSGDVSLQEKLLQRISAMTVYYGYNDVILTDTLGNILLSTGGSSGEVDGEMRHMCERALRAGRPLLSDVYPGRDSSETHIAVVAPLIDPSSTRSSAFGLVILQSRTLTSLDTLVRFWPVLSPTAEAMLVQGYAQEVHFLNDVGHGTASMTRLRFPLSRTELPSVRAVLGARGILTGRDHRGVRVLAYVMAVPDSPWLLVSKIGVDEVFAPLWREGAGIGITVVLLMAVVCLGFVLVQKSRNTARDHYEREEKLSVTLRAIGDGVLVTDADGRITRINRVTEILTGWSEQEALGRPVEEVFRIVNAETRVPVVVPVARVLVTGEQHGLSNNTLLIARDGSECPIDDSAAPIHDADGTLIGVIMVFRDVSEERRARQALHSINTTLEQLVQARTSELRESEERFRTLIEAAASVIVALAPDESILEFNPEAQKVFGRSREDVLGKNYVETFIPESARAEVRNDIRKVLTGVPTRGHENPITRADGTQRIISWNASPLPDVQGRSSGIIAVGHDITERVRAEAELLAAKERAERSDKLKDAFIANISHEVRTPLNSILGFTEILRERVHPYQTADLARIFDRIQAGSDRLTRTIDLILNVSRMQAGDTLLRAAPVDVSIMVSKVLDGLAPLAANKSIGLDFHNDSEGTTIIQADEYLLSQALINLVDNAIKFTRQGSVTVHLRRTDGRLLLDVTDTGVGISEEYLPHLFKAYSQEETGMTKTYQGIGLGMTLVKQYCDVHGVPITVRSKKHEGSTFSLDLSALLTADGSISPAPLHAAPAQSAVTGHRTTERPTILAVEDDQLTQDFLASILTDSFDVLFASSAAAALDQLQMHTVDLILMDLSLEGDVNGLLLTRRLRGSDQHTHIPVIAVTAHAFPEDERLALDAGCDAYIAKPVTRARLVQMIRKHLPT
ncbi:MAG: PAS domain S-box protein [Ignavibacteriae bacterium]|nr:PAS domain S-box protein [Ignavibacteriota bacterium]